VVSDKDHEKVAHRGRGTEVLAVRMGDSARILVVLSVVQCKDQEVITD
jgi:hypothetical protein